MIISASLPASASASASASSRIKSSHSKGLYLLILLLLLTYCSYYYENLIITSTNEIQATIGNTSSISMPEGMSQMFQMPTNSTTIEIYNQTLYEELINTLHTKKSISIHANGGSSSAGGGSLPSTELFYNKFADALETTFDIKIGRTSRAHGARSSLHSAVFSANFLPQKDYADILIWEFSINDYGYHIPSESRVAQERSIFLAWLQEVQKLPYTPKVILVYLWKGPFSIINNHVYDPVFQSHDFVAKDFPFVVGHVSLSSYINELELSYNQTMEMFLADYWHPNAKAHFCIAFLLMNMLVNGDLYHNNTVGTESSIERRNSLEAYRWFCGEETHAKRFVKNQTTLVKGSQSLWKSPIASFTMEVPRNNIFESNKILEIYQQSLQGVKTLGKSDPVRIDRQQSVEISCCHAQSHLLSNYTTVQMPKNNPEMQNVESLFLGLGGQEKLDISNLNVFINSNKIDGETIHVTTDWDCFWTWQDMYDPWWFAFSDNQPALSSISFCVENEECLNSGKSDVWMISLAVYGRESG